MSSSLQRAREALGNRLREMRQDAHLTGTQLAADAGWPQPKVSKLEHGRQAPSNADLETWVQLCGHTEALPELVASLRSLEQQYVEHRRMFRNGMPAKQVAIGEIESEALHTRNFEPCFIPGLLQTGDYARYRIAEGDATDVERGVPGSDEELEQAVQVRMERQQALYRPGRKFHFVLTEAALRYLVCPPEVMAGQLGQLLKATTWAPIRVGVIPFTTRLPVGPIHGFYIYDDSKVFVELYTGEMNIVGAGEIAAYGKVFAQLADVAVYGADARALITSVLNKYQP